MTTSKIESMRNLKDVKFIEIEEIGVTQFHPDANALEPATQVHMILMCKGAPYPMIMRFKGKGTLKELTDALVLHGEQVFGK